jgi:myeloid leukemia factor 1
MFGFPTDLFGIPNNNSRQMNSNALIPQQQSLFGNSLMIPSPFAGINSLISNFGMNATPFSMIHGGNHNSVAPMHSFTSTTVMSYNGTDGRPKVYQETTSRNRGPGGIEETRQAIRDTERGINKVNRVLFIFAAFYVFWFINSLK